MGRSWATAVPSLVCSVTRLLWQGYQGAGPQEGAPPPSARPGAPQPVSAAGKAGTMSVRGPTSEQVPPGQLLPTLASISLSESLSLTQDQAGTRWGQVGRGDQAVWCLGHPGPCPWAFTDLHWGGHPFPCMEPGDKTHPQHASPLGCTGTWQHCTQGLQGAAVGLSSWC